MLELCGQNIRSENKERTNVRMGFDGFMENIHSKQFKLITTIVK